MGRRHPRVGYLGRDPGSACVVNETLHFLRVKWAAATGITQPLPAFFQRDSSLLVHPHAVQKPIYLPKDKNLIIFQYLRFM